MDIDIMKKHYKEGVTNGRKHYTNIKTYDYQLFTIIF